MSTGEIVLVEESTSEEEEDDFAQPVIQIPPSNFSNVNVSNSTNVHFGNSAVYNGDVTVIMSAGVDELVGSARDRLQLREPVDKKLLVAVGQRTNLDDDDKARLEAVSSQIIAGAPPNLRQVSLNYDHPEKKSQPPPKWKRPTLKKIALILFLLIVITGLVVSLVVIWNLKLNSSGSNSDDGYEDPDYGNADKFINGTEGSAPFYSRIDWLAQPEQESSPLTRTPIFYIVSHSATNPCYNNSQCILQVRKMQMYHIESYGWSDIGYNFAVGGDGGIYEGRGWNKIGAHTKGYNNVSIGVNMIGTFVDVLPTKLQMRAARILFEEGVRLGKVDPNYKLIAHRQVSNTESPGLRFFKEMQTWPHWFDFVDHPLPVGG